MKIFSDTNFLVSAFLARGLSSELFDQLVANDEYKLIIGEVVLKEFERIMRTKIKMPDEKVELFVSYLKKFDFVPSPSHESLYPIDDPDDRWILANAIESKVDVIITGDKHFIQVREKIKELEILTPREFWEKYI